jgi:hypothetical protein
MIPEMIEPFIQVLEQAKTARDLHRRATMTVEGQAKEEPKA